jgi:hypothetical protein
MVAAAVNHDWSNRYMTTGTKASRAGTSWISRDVSTSIAHVQLNDSPSADWTAQRTVQ